MIDDEARGTDEVSESNIENEVFERSPQIIVDDDEAESIQEPIQFRDYEKLSDIYQLKRCTETISEYHVYGA